MFYYLMIAFLIFIAFISHLIMAHVASHLLDEFNSTGWWKKKYRKCLLIPGLPEVILVILVLAITGSIAYIYTADLFKD